MPKQKQKVCLMFANNRVQLHDPDYSMLQWKNQQIVYISPKGIKNVMSLPEAMKVEGLRNKVMEAIGVLNLYGGGHAVYCWGGRFGAQREGDQHEDGCRDMGVKLKEFLWLSPEVEETKDGYRVRSDCGYAEVILAKNLYMVTVIYWQYTGTQNGHASRAPNMTKLLLQKYSHSYCQFPTTPVEPEKVTHRYRRQYKKFSILNISDTWKYPLHLIWSSLMAHQVIPHQFCYVEYTEKQMTHRTPMPTLRDVCQLEGSKGENKCELPILGKINHGDPCLFVRVGDCEAWYGEGWNIMADGYGFWSAGDLLSYRQVNRPEVQQEFHRQAVPYMLRFKNEPERTILDQLKIFISYHSENQKLTAFQSTSCKNTTMFDNGDRLVVEQSVEGLGNFKAFSNGVIVVKFIDRTMLTLNSKKSQVRVIKSTGEDCLVDLNNSQGINYQMNKVYIVPAVEFQGKTFYPQEWLAKQEYSRRVEEAVLDGEILARTTRSYLKL